jgi:hypothetical protein
MALVKICKLLILRPSDRHFRPILAPKSRFSAACLARHSLEFVMERGSADLRLLQVCGFYSRNSRKAADSLKCESLRYPAGSQDSSNRGWRGRACLD